MSTRSLIILLLAALSAGCATLQPYERGELMTRVMVEVPDGMETGFEVHIHRTREAMAGAELGEGASCGCN